MLCVLIQIIYLYLATVKTVFHGKVQPILGSLVCFGGSQLCIQLIQFYPALPNYLVLQALLLSYNNDLV